MAVEYEEKCLGNEKENLMKEFWLEKKECGEKNSYYKERTKYFNRLGFSNMEIEITRKKSRFVREVITKRQGYRETNHREQDKRDKIQ